MPIIDFSKVDYVCDFSPIPQGRYRCCLIEIVETTTQKGDEMWEFRFQVVEGPYKNRSFFDRLTFNAIGLRGIKLLCNKLGQDTSKEVDLTPDKIIGKECGVEVVIEDYTDRWGQDKKRNVVPFAGFHDAESILTQPDNETQEIKEDDLPF